PSLYTRLVMVLRLAGKLIEADTTATEGLELFPQFTDLVLAQARIAQTYGDTDKAMALLHRAIEMGEAPEARAALQWCVSNHPEFLAAAAPYASALLRDGVAPSDVVAELDKLDV